MTAAVCQLPPVIQDLGDGGNHLVEVAEVGEGLEHPQPGLRNEAGGVVGVGDVDEGVAATVEDGDGARDGTHVEPGLVATVGKAIVGVALEAVGEHCGRIHLLPQRALRLRRTLLSDVGTTPWGLERREGAGDCGLGSTTTRRRTDSVHWPAPRGRAGQGQAWGNSGKIPDAAQIKPKGVRS